MKSFLIILVVFLGSSSFAATWDCPVIDVTNPPNWPNEIVSLQTSAQRLEVINYVSKIPNQDGSFTDRPEIIFSVMGQNRGGYKVDYCNPNENEFNAQNGKYSVWSVCSSANTIGNLTYSANFTLAKGGTVEYSLTPTSSGDNVDRSIKFSGCVQQAELSTIVFINSDSTEAKYVANESGQGALADFYSRLSLAESANGTVKEKKFALRNDRFGFSCRNAVSIDGHSNTSCTFYIKIGINNGDLNSTITNIGTQKAASVSMTDVYSKEFKNVFPGGTANLKFISGTALFEANGTVGQNLVLGFSSK